jgi:hypothetical protein
MSKTLLEITGHLIDADDAISGRRPVNAPAACLTRDDDVMKGIDL